MPDELASLFSLDEFCGKHVDQLAFVKDRSPRIHAMTARQAGKTQGDVAILLENALTQADTTNVFMGLNGPSVRMNVWEPVFKKLIAKYEIPAKPNEQRMTVFLPNDSRIIFGGTDDVRHIKNILGGRLENGVFIVDECQDQFGVLDELLDVILPPMLTPTSRLILTGVFPDVPVGRFWRERSNESWSRHCWGRLANVHTPEARAVLDEHMRVNRLTEDDPRIARDWHGRPVFDPRATAFAYRQEVNGYRASPPIWLPGIYESPVFRFKDVERKLEYCHPTTIDDDRPRVGLMAAQPHDWVERFSFAIDPAATSDRAAIVGWGWGVHSRKVQQVFDWSTPRAANLTTGQIFAVAGLAHAMFSKVGHCKWRYDAGSSQNTIDNLRSDYGIPLILAATKTDKKGQVDRNNDLLSQGRAEVMIGSVLEQDYMKARWDKKKREAGGWEFDDRWHPDPADAGRYALQDYHDHYRPLAADRPKLTPFEEMMAARKAAPQKPNYFSGRIRDG